MKIGIVTLGCDKNSVDAEHLAGILAHRGHEIVAEGEQKALDVLIIYTCGFIEPAREQSVSVIEAYLDTKTRFHNPRHLVLAGCLTQRYGEEMLPEIPEADLIAGVGQPYALADQIEALDPRSKGDAPGAILQSPSMRREAPLPRFRLNHGPSAWLKISDGCDHTCSFCAIPAIKGGYASIPREQILTEARNLLQTGVRELNLIGQDLSPYGSDLYPDYGLPELLEDLCRLPGAFWIRLLYLYPAGLTDRFIEILRREQKICKYLDIPLQHLDPGILRAMRRPGRQEIIAERIGRLREQVPDITLRTTMIVGFPGETSKAFKNLLQGLAAMQFERLGAFAYSAEEGTDAARMPNPVPPATAERRIARLMEIQAEISLGLQKKRIGKTIPVLVESVDAEAREARGRSQAEAPEVDGEVIIHIAESAPMPTIGQFLTVRVIDADPYDLTAEPV